MAFVFYSFIFRCAGNIEGARLSDGVTSIVAIDFGSFLILHLLIFASNMCLSSHIFVQG